jgi:hypothetical protein
VQLSIFHNSTNLIVSNGVRRARVAIWVHFYHTCLLPTATEGMYVAAGDRESCRKGKVHQITAGSDGAGSGSAACLTSVATQLTVQQPSKQPTAAGAARHHIALNSEEKSGIDDR